MPWVHRYISCNLLVECQLLRLMSIACVRDHAGCCKSLNARVRRTFTSGDGWHIISGLCLYSRWCTASCWAVMLVVECVYCCPCICEMLAWIRWVWKGIAHKLDPEIAQNILTDRSTGRHMRRIWIQGYTSISSWWACSGCSMQMTRPVITRSHVQQTIITTLQPYVENEWMNVLLRSGHVQVWHNNCNTIFNPNPFSTWVNISFQQRHNHMSVRNFT